MAREIHMLTAWENENHAVLPMLYDRNREPVLPVTVRHPPICKASRQRLPDGSRRMTEGPMKHRKLTYRWFAHRARSRRLGVAHERRWESFQRLGLLGALA
jgi:hypothetical protein